MTKNRETTMAVTAATKKQELNQRLLAACTSMLLLDKAPTPARTTLPQLTKQMQVQCMLLLDKAPTPARTTLPRLTKQMQMQCMLLTLPPSRVVAFMLLLQETKRQQ